MGAIRRPIHGLRGELLRARPRALAPPQLGASLPADPAEEDAAALSAGNPRFWE